MSLEDIYNQQVQGKHVGGISVIGSASPPIIERDLNIRKLEQNIFAQIHEIVKPELLQDTVTPDCQIETVSFEDAIRELAQMNK